LVVPVDGDRVFCLSPGTAYPQLGSWIRGGLSLGRKKEFRQEIVQHANSLKSKDLYSSLVYETHQKFVPEKAMAEIVSAKAYSTITKTAEIRQNEELVVPVINGRFNHHKKTFSDTGLKKVNIKVYSFDEIELFEKTGLQGLQNSRICRIIEQSYLQDGLLPSRIVSLLTNLSEKTIRERLKTFWNQGIKLPLWGMKKEFRSPGHRFRSSVAISRYLRGEKVGEVLKSLYLSRREFREIQLEFVRVKNLYGKTSAEKIAKQVGCDEEKVAEYQELLEKEDISPWFRQVERDFVYREPPRGQGWEALAEDLETNHNWSSAKIQAYFELLENYQRTGVSQHPDNTIVYYAISDREPAGKALVECQKVPVALSYYTPEELEQFDGCSTNSLKWERILRYTTEAKGQGALLNQADLVFLLGVHSSVIQRLMKKNKEVFLPTRGNYMDIGPGISHGEKIIELYIQGYTETKIKYKTGHSYESIENYIKTFSILVGLLERDLPLPLIRQVMGKSMNLVKRYKALYDKYNTEEYSFFFNHLRRIFERTELKKKFNSREV